jgi:hypothetical protein
MSATTLLATELEPARRRDAKPQSRAQDAGTRQRKKIADGAVNVPVPHRGASFRVSPQRVRVALYTQAPHWCVSRQGIWVEMFEALTGSSYLGSAMPLNRRSFRPAD